MTKSNINTYNPSSQDNFFFDTNIWIFLFCSIGNHKPSKQKVYSGFFSRLRERNASIFINSLVLSEFCNVWLRIEFDTWKKQTINVGKTNFKKDFVGTPKYNQTIEDIKYAIQQILAVTLKCSDEFNSINFVNVINQFGKADFNDAYYAVLAEKKSWKIVTDDGDFDKLTIPTLTIITDNQN